MTATLRPIPRRILGRTGLEVSLLGFGALEIGRDWAPDVNSDPSHPDEAEAARTLNGLLDLGINFIDTAPAYWNSEEFIGRAIAHRRGEYILATKVGEHCDREGSIYDYSAGATTQFIDRSLQRLRTDVIDLIQIHSASHEVLERGETLGALQAARDAGKVRFIGISGGISECIRAAESGDFDTVQFPYNLLNPEAEDRLLPLCRERNIGAIIMRPLAGGKLTAKYTNLPDETLRRSIEQFIPHAPGQSAKGLGALALGHVCSHPDVSTVIAGSRHLGRLRENVAALDVVPSAEERGELRGIAGRLAAKAW